MQSSTMLSMAMGAPTAFRKEFVAQAKKLALLSATDMEIADFFKVDVRTIYRWKIVHPDFCQSLKAGKEQADNRVERSLYQRATGFEHDSVKVSFDKAGEPLYAPFREFVAPDTTACIFWLKNRRSQEWRDKSEVEVTGNLADRLAQARKRK